MTLLSRIAAIFTGQRGEVRPQNEARVTYADSLMEAFGVTPGAAGITVSATSAQRVSAVAACRQKIAGSISTLRLDVLKIEGDTEVKQPRDALWYLLNESPHAQYTATSHWDNKVSEQLLRGDGFTWIRRRMNGTVAELFPLPWGSVQPWRMPDGTVRYYVSLAEWGIQTWLEPADILHFPGSGFDGLRSMSVISYGAKNAIGNALAMDEYSGKFFANGAHPSMVLKTPAKMSPQQKTDLQEAYARKYSGVENAHRLPLVLTEGLDAKELSLTAEDAQLIEARKFQVVDIARAFGVPPHMIGETSGASAVGAGYEQQARDFVMHTLRLHLKRLEQELNRKLFPRDTGRFVRFDLGDLIEGDSKAQAEYNRAALGGPGTGQGWMSVNEIRKAKGLPPVDGGEKLFDPRDMQKGATNETPPAAAA
jgi:HK97 family phage portal protein